jgi:Berberine and berberine like
VEKFHRAMEPHCTGAVYVNDLKDEGEDSARAAHGDKYERLTLLKRRYDPANFFHVNQNIRPAAAMRKIGG